MRLGLEVLPPLPPGHLARASRSSRPGFPTPDVGLPKASRSYPLGLEVEEGEAWGFPQPLPQPTPLPGRGSA